MIGGGIGGLIAGLAHVKSYAMTTLFGIVSFIGENDYRNFYFMLLALAVAFLVSATAGYILWIPEEIESKGTISEKKSYKIKSSKLLQRTIVLPLKGEKMALEKINDDAFSTGALGKGIGIIPHEDIIKSPIQGEVVSLFPTNHAIGIKNEEGVEILIHIGIDTVELNGKHFKAFVKEGDQVKIGQPLIEADFASIEQEGYDPTVITVVTNTPDFLEVLPNLNGANPEKLITVVL